MTTEYLFVIMLGIQSVIYFEKEALLSFLATPFLPIHSGNK